MEADAGAFAAQISRWEILVNGNVLNQRDGNSLSSVIESLPEGMHQLAVKAYDFSNHSSLSKAIKIIVIPKSDTEQIQPRLRLGKINKNEQNFPLNFLARPTPPGELLAEIPKHYSEMYFNRLLMDQHDLARRFFYVLENCPLT